MSGIGRSAALMTAGTATSRVLGVARASFQVAAIGLVAPAANAFGAANWLPNMLYMLIAGGVLNAVLVPQIVRAYRERQGQEYVDRLLTVAGALLFVVTVVLTLAAPLVVRIVVDGRDPQFVALTTTFAVWCLPQVFFYGLYTLLGQVLNARGSFGPYMWAPVVNNVVAIASLVAFIAVFGAHEQGGDLTDPTAWGTGPVVLLAGGATLGVVAQALVLLVPLRRIGFRYRPRTDWRASGLGTAGRVAGWTFAALVVGQLGIITVTRVTTAAAQEGGAGVVAGNAAYTYAFTLFMLPHSLVTVSLLTALFTRLSHHAASGDRGAVRDDVSTGLRTIGVFTVIATAVLAVLALPVVRVLFQTPGDESGALTAVVVALLMGLVALGAWSLFQRVFYAYEDAKGLFWIQVVMAGVVAGGTLVSSLVLPTNRWTAAAGASIAASYVVGAVWGGVRVRQRLGGSGRRVVSVHVRAVLSALVATAVGWPLSLLFGDLSSLGRFPAAGVCLLVGSVMLAIYLGGLRLLGVDDVSRLAAPLLARLGRSMGARVGGGASRQDRASGRGGGRVDVVVEQGTLLAGRYRLEEPAATDLPDVDAWDARDQILDRPVRALVLRAGRVEQAQDAARRAALVTDPRLLRVLDVGDHEGLAYTVTEPLVGRSLAELVADGPLPADQARAVVGEAAVALEVARRRGVHHLALRPSAVRVTPTGGVVVTGLAMDGELLEHGLGDARSTTRADTVGLVALLYLALTGRWPARDGVPDGGVEAAPLVEDAPVAPVELVPDVPNDLDTLCAVTLGPHDDGPHSPAELVRELEPWGAVAPVPADDTAADVVPPRVAAARVQRQSVRSTFTGQVPAGTRPGTTPPPAIPPPFRRADPRAAGAAAGAAAVGAAAAGAAAAGVGAADPQGVDEAGVATPPQGTPAADAGAAGPVASRPAGATVERRPVRPVETPPPPRAEAPRPAADHPHEHPHEHETFETLIHAPVDVLVRKRFDPTRIVLALVAVAVVVGLVWAWNALTATPPPIGGSDGFGDVVDSPAAEEPQGEAPADGEGDAGAEGEQPEQPSAAVPPVIASGQMIDLPPGGDNNEHPEAVALAYDGDPSTHWYTRTYKSPTYGMKPGVGYAVTLAEPTTVTTVTLVVNGNGGNVEVRATDPSTPAEGEVLASGPMSAETVLTLSAPTEAQHIVLWFTELPQAADGGNRVELAEIRLS